MCFQVMARQETTQETTLIRFKQKSVTNIIDFMVVKSSKNIHYTY